MFCDAEMKILRMRVGTSVPPLMPSKCLSMTIIGGPSSFFSASSLHAVGGFDTDLHFSMDGDLWWRMFRHGVRLCHLNSYFWGFRLHEESKTSPELLSIEKMDDRHAHENKRLQARYPRPKWAVVMGLWGIYLWKCINGSFLRSWLDTRRYQGKPLDDFNRQGAKELGYAT